jgi:hypothetical protein
VVWRRSVGGVICDSSKAWRLRSADEQARPAGAVVALVPAGAVLVDVVDVVVVLPLLGWVVGKFVSVDVRVDVGVAPRPEAP